jgi:RNA polymerase primary sigma factor
MTPVKEKSATVLKAQKLLDTPLRVFYHLSFDDPRQRKLILSEMPMVEKFHKDGDKVRRLRAGKIAAEMRPCYEAPLINVDQEQHLFRKMNYYKYRAKRLMANMNPNRVGIKRVQKIEEYLAKAVAIRNQIAESNFRLATQILKGQITFYREHSLTDALLSDAYFDVLKAVDYFNWTLGNRFSTYATWVVKKNFYRDSKQKVAQAERQSFLDDSHADTLESREDGYEEEKAHLNQQKLVKRLLHLLEKDGDTCADRKRQVFVLENYFGVNGSERHTLEGISEKIGVTKERVRQLKEKGLAWIKEKVQEMGISYEVELEDAG